ncbi:MAG: T9SS type A sorting domain-containing protein [Ignavibacteria bacterium]|nr:T9SS type A sorting domain-containing protein [Ignavibacteria bacterium]
MKLKILICISVLFICFESANAQSITWENTYINSNSPFRNGINALCKSDSGNFFLAGYTLIPSNISYYKIWVLKINSYGDTIWTKTYGRNGSQATTVVSNSDGGCTISGRTGEAFTIRIDKDGNVLWEKYYGGYAVQIYKIIQTYDKSYLACGTINLQDGYLFKVDSLGNFLWDKTYLNNHIIEFNDIIEKNGFYYITGTLRETFQDTSAAIFKKLDVSGNELLNKRIKIQNKITHAKKVLIENDKFILAGSLLNSSLTNEILFFNKIDSNGVSEYEKVYTSNYSEYFSDMNILSKNRYILVSSLDTSDYLFGKIIIADSIGNIIKYRIFPTSSFIVFESLLTLLNEDIVIAGSADFNISEYDQVGYVVRTDSNLFIKNVGINSNSIILPEKLKLYQNYPNPFNPVTKITFNIPVSGNISIRVYDITGKVIKTLVNEFRNAGTYYTEFNGTDLSSGVYYYKMETGNFSEIKKMILLK